MNVIINAVHFKTDQKLESFIKERIQKLNNLYEGVVGAEVKLKLDNTDTRDNKIVEIRLVIRGNDLFAIKQAKSFEEATDLAADALRRQVTKHKDKIRGI
jgi:putative sigma-54 modulation protein